MVMDRDTFLLLLFLPLLRLLLFLELHCFYQQWNDGGMSECSKCGTSLHAAFDHASRSETESNKRRRRCDQLLPPFSRFRTLLHSILLSHTTFGAFNVSQISLARNVVDRILS